MSDKGYTDKSVGATIWERRPTKIRKKQLGKSYLYCERYWAPKEEEWRFYVEASGPDYRIWKRIRQDEDRAVEVFGSYTFWVWLIEAFNIMPATRSITWLMHKLI